MAINTWKSFEKTAILCNGVELVLIEAESLSMKDKFMRYRPRTRMEVHTKSLIINAIEANVKNFYRPIMDPSLDNNRIVLDSINNQIGLKGGLKEGAKFINADNYEDVYYVHKYGESYCIEHHDKSPIKIDNRTMILYHVPETSQVAFLGNIDFKPALSEITNKYLYAKSKMC